MRRSVPWVAAALVGLASFAPSQAQHLRGDEPTNAIQLRLGGYFPSGNSSFWQDTESRFTLDASDLDDAMLGMSYVAGMGNHLEVGFNLDFMDASARSAERFFVDQSGQPILHDTRLRLVPASVDFRVLPGGRHGVRGRHGQYVVRQPAFFVGAGAGVSFWEYEEVGDFVDDTTSPPQVFFARFRDEGTAFAAHVLAGVEFPIGPRAGALLQGAYTWSDDTLGGDFGSDAGTLDLGGASAFFGLSFRF